MVFSLFPLTAQSTGTGEKAFGIIIYADGKELSIFRKGEYISYDLANVDVVGLPLLPGDMIQTDKGTFLEIQLHPTKSVLKIAENTTFSVQNLETSGGGGFELTYGRVRAKVDKLTGRDPFSIRGRGAVAGVRGTDFGFDYIADKEATGLTAATKVYCFEGSVAVTKVAPTATKVAPPAASQAAETKPERTPETAEKENNAKPAEVAAEKPEKTTTPAQAAKIEDLKTETVVLTANEMVTLKAPPQEPSPAVPTEEPGKTPPTEAPAFEKAVISENVAAFWEKNTFQAKPVEPAKVEELFPALPELLKSESLGPEKLKKAQPKAETPTKDELAKTQGGEPGKDVASLPGRETPVAPVTVENEWEKRQKELKRTRLRIGGAGLFGLGILTAAAGLIVGYGDAAFLRSESGVNRPVGTGFFVVGSLFAVGGALMYSSASDN